ncbi:MAG: hypothetical protein FD134_1859 [Gallionellaceae bacterium]|nr:MAG: hypothetical protein FD134_1859 [Gallionellaceae bacterium]
MTEKTFGQIVAAGITARTALLRDTRAEIVRLLKLAAERIALILAGQPSDYQLWALSQLQRDIARILGEFGESGQAVVSVAADRAWQGGIALVDGPVRSLEGGARIVASLGSPDAAQLDAMRHFMTGRIKDISLEAANRINSELGLAAIGAQSPGDAITSVNRILGGGARERAATIVRTELGRVFSAASYARMQQAVAGGANIRKKWIKSGKVHSRPGHDAIHGVILPVDEPFRVADKHGEIHDLRYPHDPKAPAAETINCGCVCTPTASGFEGASYKSKVGKPGGGQWSNAELRAQALAYASEKGLSPGWGLPPGSVREANPYHGPDGRFTGPGGSVHAVLTGNELGAHAGTKVLRKAAEAHAKQHFVGKTYTNTNSGHAIKVTWQGMKHSLSGTNDPEIRLSVALPKMLQKAQYIGARAPTEKHRKRGVIAMHEYLARVSMGDEHFKVGIVTHERGDGHEHYNHAIVAKVRPVNSGGG